MSFFLDIVKDIVKVIDQIVGKQTDVNDECEISILFEDKS